MTVRYAALLSSALRIVSAMDSRFRGLITKACMQPASADSAVTRSL